MSVSHRCALICTAAVMMTGIGAWSISAAGQTAAPTTPQAGVAQPTTARGAVPYTVPRLPWGDPDLEGIWISTHFGGTSVGGAVPLERPPEHAGKFLLTPAERDARLKAGYDREEAISGRGDRPFGRSIGTEWYDTETLSELGIEMSRRTSLIVDPPDGRLPPLTPAAQQRRAAATLPYGSNRGDATRNLPQRPFRGLEDLSIGVRCFTGGFPRVSASVINTGRQIIQGPGYVTILHEIMHEAHVIPVDGRPTPTIPQYWGHPRGRWEGNTLVVETTHFNGKAPYQGAGEHLRVVERFTRVSASEIDYRFTVDDPTTFTRPWTVAIDLVRDPRQFELVEYACHEGNYALPGLVRAAQMESDKAAEEAKKAR